MRRWIAGRLVWAALAVAVLLPESGAWAREGPLYETSLTARMTRKLLRGSANVVFGWCEIPRNVHMGIVNLDPLSGTVFGAVRGTGMAVVRTAYGAWEVVTFPIPIPSEYRSAIEPEFVWMDLFAD